MTAARSQDNEHDLPWHVVEGTPHLAAEPGQARRAPHLRLLEAPELLAELEAPCSSEEILGRSPTLAAVLLDVERVARAEASVLITGETGTGKELVARAIHRRSERAGRRLVTVNCAAIAVNLQESELFGHEKGAFTGATQRRDGRFKLADGGTLFLDEVGEMSLDLQAKLLRVLQEGEFEPVGSGRTLRVDVRIVAATNRSLEEMVRAGTFRADLLYRLNVFPIHLPPLRERGEDVVLLAEHFARCLAKRNGRSVGLLTAESRRRLMRHDWPGNIRELHNVIERALVSSTDGHPLDLQGALPEPAGRPAERTPPPMERDAERVLADAEIRQLEKANLERALRASGGKLSGKDGAAALLGLKPSTLASRLRALGIRLPRRS
jgi:transcriptional regulator with GAF, ATPase, and Fis domain